jgi:superfamily II DNA/RNA helicase
MFGSRQSNRIHVNTCARDNYVKIRANREEAKDKKLSMRYMKKNRKIVNLVGNEKLKAGASINHLALPCIKPARARVIPDIIKRYSHGRRTIIFTKTKVTASQLVAFRGRDCRNVQ